jgi:hypothetical protein
MATNTSLIAKILRALLAALSPATRIALELPSLTRKGIPMPNYELPNDEISTITIKTTDSGGDVEAVDPTDVFTVVSSSPSLTAAIGTDASGNPAIVLTPMVKASPNISVTVSDSKGLIQCVQLVDIVPDVKPTNVILDLADATTVSQSVPAAPGP